MSQAPALFCPRSRSHRGFPQGCRRSSRCWTAPWRRRQAPANCLSVRRDSTRWRRRWPSRHLIPLTWQVAPVDTAGSTRSGCGRARWPPRGSRSPSGALVHELLVVQVVLDQVVHDAVRERDVPAAASRWMSACAADDIFGSTTMRRQPRSRPPRADLHADGGCASSGFDPTSMTISRVTSWMEFVIAPEPTWSPDRRPIECRRAQLGPRCSFGGRCAPSLER